MMKIEYGECIYCGQVNQFEVEDNATLSKEEMDRKATEVCDCDRAKNAQAQEKILTTTQKNITSLFHADKPEMEKLLLEATDYIYDGTPIPLCFLLISTAPAPPGCAALFTFHYVSY